MKPIDLTQFADHSQKIPSEFLNTSLTGNHTFKWYEVFATHFIDLYIVTRIFTIVKMVLKSSLHEMMTTESLSSAFSDVSFTGMNISMLVVMVATYFFSCYFLNQGQTLGMKILNRRVSMETHSFSSAWKWTCYSLGIYASLGTIVAWGHKKLVEHGFGSFSKTDHLYLEMMTYKTWKAPELKVVETEAFTPEIRIAA